MQWRRDDGTIVALLQAKDGACAAPQMRQAGEHNDAGRHAHDAAHVSPEYGLHRTACTTKHQLSTPLAAIGTKQLAVERGVRVISFLEEMVNMGASFAHAHGLGRIASGSLDTCRAGCRHRVREHWSTHLHHDAIPNYETRAQTQHGEQQGDNRDDQLPALITHDGVCRSSTSEWPHASRGAESFPAQPPRRIHRVIRQDRIRPRPLHRGE